MPRPLLAVSCLVSSLVIPAQAWAQDVATADALFNKAITDMEAGRYDLACPALAESQRLDPRSATFYDDYLRSAGALGEPARAKHAGRMKIARAELDRLRAQIPTLELLLPAA